MERKPTASEILATWKPDRIRAVLGVGKSMAYDLRKGKRRPTMEQLARLCELMGYSEVHLEKTVREALERLGADDNDNGGT